MSARSMLALGNTGRATTGVDADDAETVAEAREPQHIPRVRARSVSPDTVFDPALERVIGLTPYDVETIIDDVLRAGRGARLELTVAPDTSSAVVAWIRQRFVSLGRRGVTLSIDREAPRAVRQKEQTCESE